MSESNATNPSTFRELDPNDPDAQLLALAEGLVLKDAAPTNIVFRGSRPVFVDFLSFEERENGDYLWRARHQFDACFLLPLLLNLEAGIPIAWTLRDYLHGVSHEQARRILGIKSWLKPGLIGSVAIPAALSRQASGIGTTHAARRRYDNDARARFVLEHQDSMSETELAQKLGVSRKCLWERRQRFGIPRNKGNLNPRGKISVVDVK